MSVFGRAPEPEDKIRDALVAMVLMYAFEYERGDVKDEYFESAMLAFFELLEFEGVDLSGLFYGEDARRLAVRNALSAACRHNAMFTKEHRRGYHYFESSFRRWAHPLINEHLTDQMREASRMVMDPVIQVLAFGGNAKEQIESYKQEKAA